MEVAKRAGFYPSRRGRRRWREVLVEKGCPNSSLASWRLDPPGGTKGREESGRDPSEGWGGADGEETGSS